MDSGGVVVYPAGSDATVAPIGTISGSNTGLVFPTGIAEDSSGAIYVANLGFHGCSGGTCTSTSSVTVHPAGSNGNVAPVGTISGSATALFASNGIVLDAGANIYVSNGGHLDCQLSCCGLICDYPSSGVTVYLAGSNGNIAPILGGGSGRSPTTTKAFALDSSGNQYVLHPANPLANPPENFDSVVGPNGTITGPDTAFNAPVGLAVDSSGNIYVLNSGKGEYPYDRVPPGPPTVTVYPAWSSGDVAPIFTMTTGLAQPYGIAIGR